MKVYQPNELVASCVLAIMVGPYIWLLIVRWAYGDPPPWKSIGRIGLLAIAVVATSESQNQPLQAQHDHEQRLRNLERETADLRGVQKLHEGVQTQINSTVLSNLEKMEGRLAAHEREKEKQLASLDARVKQNEEARHTFELLPTVFQFIVTFAGALAGVFGFRLYLARRNGHSKGSTE